VCRKKLNIESFYYLFVMCRQIQEVLRVQSSAMSTQSDDPTDSCHVDMVLGSVIQPLLQACRMGGQALSKGDMALFMLNNVSAIRVCVCVCVCVCVSDERQSVCYVRPSVFTLVRA
jgi:hypothetical protein